MLGGTFLPAFTGVAVYSALTKEPLSIKNIKVLIIFGLLSAVGGFVTAKMLKDDTTVSK